MAERGPADAAQKRKLETFPRFSKAEAVNDAYTFREKIRMAAGAVTALVIIGWMILLYSGTTFDPRLIAAFVQIVLRDRII